MQFTKQIQQVYIYFPYYWNVPMNEMIVGEGGMKKTPTKQKLIFKRLTRFILLRGRKGNILNHQSSDSASDKRNNHQILLEREKKNLFTKLSIYLMQILSQLLVTPCQDKHRHNSPTKLSEQLAAYPLPDTPRWKKQPELPASLSSSLFFTGKLFFLLLFSYDKACLQFCR